MKIFEFFAKKFFSKKIFWTRKNPDPEFLDPGSEFFGNFISFLIKAHFLKTDKNKKKQTRHAHVVKCEVQSKKVRFWTFLNNGLFYIVLLKVLAGTTLILGIFGSILGPVQRVPGNFRADFGHFWTAHRNPKKYPPARPYSTSIFAISPKTATK